jgi:hypothetical protein
MEQPASTGWIFVKFEVGIFLNLTRITGVGYDDLNIFVVISRCTLLRMMKVSDIGCREEAHFLFSVTFPKIVPFMR